MPSGKLGSANLIAETDTLLYTVPDLKIATVNIRIVNRNPTVIAVRVAIGAGTSPTNVDYIDYDAVVPGYGILEETAVVCGAGEKVWVRSNFDNVSVRIHGFEESV